MEKELLSKFEPINDALLFLKVDAEILNEENSLYHSYDFKRLTNVNNVIEYIQMLERRTDEMRGVLARNGLKVNL